MVIFEVIGVLAAWIVTFAVTGVLPLHPLDEAARGRAAPIQFTMIDFLALFFLIQLPTGIVHSLNLPDMNLALVLDAFGWITAGSFWYFGLRTLSRAGVKRPRHRLVWLIVILPIVLGTVIIYPVIMEMTVRSLFAFARPGGTPSFDDRPWWFFALHGICPVLIAVAAWTSRHILRAAAEEKSLADVGTAEPREPDAPSGRLS